jgi:hypothetical protein
LGLKTGNYTALTETDIIKSNSEWLLDSGATNHIAYSREIFKNLKPYKSTIKVGDGRSLKIKGIGEVMIEVESNTSIIRINFQRYLI